MHSNVRKIYAKLDHSFRLILRLHLDVVLIQVVKLVLLKLEVLLFKHLLLLRALRLRIVWDVTRNFIF